MLISEHTDPMSLSMLMEDDAPQEAGEALKSLLLERGFEGKDTRNVPNWPGLCDEAMSMAYDQIDGDNDVAGYMPGGHHHRNGLGDE